MTGDRDSAAIERQLRNAFAITHNAREDANRRHEDTDHMRALWAIEPVLLSHVVIDNVISSEIQHIDERFD